MEEIFAYKGVSEETKYLCGSDSPWLLPTLFLAFNNKLKSILLVAMVKDVSGSFFSTISLLSLVISRDLSKKAP